MMSEWPYTACLGRVGIHVLGCTMYIPSDLKISLGPSQCIHGSGLRVETSRIWCLIKSLSRCMFAVCFSCTSIRHFDQTLRSDTDWLPVAVCHLTQSSHHWLYPFFVAKSGKSWELTLLYCIGFIHSFCKLLAKSIPLKEVDYTCLNVFSCIIHVYIVHTPNF